MRFLKPHSKITIAETFTGKEVDFLKPSPADIDIVDVAHALSLVCRFAGHARVFYSVAEHSVRVATLVQSGRRPALALHALLHDAHEAYVQDVTTPLKNLLGHPYEEVAGRIDDCIVAAFDLDALTDVSRRIVSAADYQMLSIEADSLMHSRGERWDWPGGRPDVLYKIHSPWDSLTAKRRFLSMFHKLKGEQRAVA